jgi:arylsulfatase A-like enzyme
VFTHAVVPVDRSQSHDQQHGQHHRGGGWFPELQRARPVRVPNQSYPDLVHDNHPVDQPATPEEGYHFSTDITDRALRFIRDAKAVAPDKPFFLYYCPGACHAPHHVPKECRTSTEASSIWAMRPYREIVFQRQQTLGILPEAAELSPINPYIGRTTRSGKKWPELDTVRRSTHRSSCGNGIRTTRVAPPTR